MTVLAAPRVEPPPGRARRPSRLPRAAAALAAGALLYAATPPLGWWPLAPFAVALLAVAVDGLPARRALRVGLLAGLAYLVPLYAWARAPGVDFWLLLAAAEALLFAPTALGLAVVGRLRAAPLWGAAVWVADEALRDSWPFGGLAWARLAFTQPASPFTGLAAVGGAPLVSAAVATTGLLVARLVVTRRPARRPAAAACALAAVAVAVAGVLVPPGRGGGPRLAVAVVQGGVPRAGLDVFRQRAAVLADHVQQTFTLAADVRTGRAPQPQLVVWPEDADDIDPFTDRTAYDEITAAAAVVGAPVLLGAVLDGPRPGTLANTALLFTGDGYAGQQYVKRHPVPFGEYLPYRGLVEHLSGRARTLLPADDVRGTTPGEFDVAGTRAGVVTCFEVSDDALVRDAAGHGARLLVVQTNDASFGRGGETWQQLAMARLRAVEHDRTVVVAATSGASAVVDPRGRVVLRSGLFRPALLSADIRLSASRTVADRVGAWPDRVLVTLGLVGATGGAVAGRRRAREEERT